MTNWLAKWEPFKELEEIRDSFDRFLGRSLAAKERETWVPSIDLIDKKDALVLKAEVPGVDKKDIKVTVHNGLLTIKGETKREEEDKKENYYHSERYYGSFYRSIDLPVEIEKDKIKANYKDGILTVNLPKSKKSEPKETEITIE